MGLTHEDVERILRIIDESGYNEIRIEYGDLKLHVVRQGAAAASPAPDATASVPEQRRSSGPTAPQPTPAVETRQAASVSALPPGAVVVRAPMLGTFYRAQSPGSPPFVEAGSEVRADTTVCLIEVMKLFNTLKAGVEGRVLQFLVENGSMVEYDQPLIVIEPKAKE